MCGLLKTSCLRPKKPERDYHEVVSVQINKMCVLLHVVGSAFIVVCAGCHTNVCGECTRAGVYIKGVWMCYEHGCDAALLWLWP